LSAAASNQFPPSWIQVLEELNIEDVLGRELLQRVEAVFGRNQLTPAVAAEAIDELASEVEEVQGGLTDLLGGLGYFVIGAEELPPGEAEVGVLIPRVAVKNELSELGGELVELDAILGPFLELGTGTRPPIKIASVASSDFGVFVEMVPQAAALVALAVERVIHGYKTVLEIRALRAGLAEQHVPDEALAGIEAHANSVMGDSITSVIEELLEESAVGDEGRKNELRTELRKSLNKLANRIDQGYNIDVRAGDVPAEAQGDDDGVTSAVSSIRNASPNLKFINRSGLPILSLSEGDQGTAG